MIEEGDVQNEDGTAEQEYYGEEYGHQEEYYGDEEHEEEPPDTSFYVEVELKAGVK
eukprot:CAMPEP_0170550488 /NCGR_PEP_ID=MMETSP0211-20121228/8545_1 /TAXON_ID=311385 /ORGANISM="Pseudokeronopsis sp., Strain OXSARD2" /LENGTH=55 /DNA_ID=CAMNT_0010857069 /DNA_START=1782 /DNA_END=1949 /DNA_ORIENTATION=+